MLNKDFLKKISVSCLSTVLAISCATGMMPVSYAETADGSIVVTYSKGKGTFASGNDKNEVTIKDGKVVSGTYEVPTRDYWTFRYWQNNGKKYTVSNDGVVEGATEDITLAPSWESNMYYFSFNANGGKFSDGSVGHSVTYKADKPDEDGYKYEVPTRDGYTFAGWAMKGEDGLRKSVTFSASGVPSTLSEYESGSKVSLTALWKDENGNIVDDADTSTVVLTYNSNEGTGDTKVEVEKNTEVTLEQHVSKTDCTFKGWAESADGDVKYKVGDKIVMDANKTLYAVWEKADTAKTEVAVKFDANGGTGTMSDEIFTSGESKSLTMNSFTKEGFVFKGWALSATGEVQFEDGATMTASKDAKSVTLYAIWLKEADETISHSVKFDANGGEGEMEDQSFKSGVQGTLDKNTFVKPGYTFKGWALTKDGDVVYTDAMNVTFEKDTTLYAVWSKKENTEENTYTVSFNANGGEGTMDDMTFKKNVTQHLDKNKFTRKGYTFKGWALKAGGEVAFEDAEAVTVSGDKTLYAVWSKDAVVTYTVKFDKGNGTGTMKDQTFTAGEKQKLSKNTFTKEGYTFAGWSENKDGAVKYKDEESVTIRTNVTLYPIFTETKYTVKFDANGGSGSMKDEIFTCGTSQTLTSNGFTRDGYNFLGWATDKNATKATYTDKQSIKIEKDQTLYAVWGKADLVVTYKANGGTGTMSDQTFKSGESVTLTKNKFTKEGYTFKGWAYQKDATEIVLKDGATKSDWTTGATLWAVWEKAYSDITVYVNDNTNKTATISSSTLTSSSGKLPKASSVMTAQDGYTFKGWNTKIDGTGTSYADEATVTADNQPSVLYAIWEASTAAVSDTSNSSTTTTASASGRAVGGSVNTGDTARVGLMVGIAGIAAVAAAVIAVISRKKKKEV